MSDLGEKKRAMTVDGVWRVDETVTILRPGSELRDQVVASAAEVFGVLIHLVVPDDLSSGSPSPTDVPKAVEERLSEPLVA